ncbi:c-type cytochrome [Candidatus Leptofilum sp.]|uniref:c-type cytochrome n=1 Tax=Candidatus Leptofilum sp. TaxID=3241576 RepID=UPI003B594620
MLNHFKQLLVFGLFFLAACGGGTEPTAPQPTLSPQAQQGKQVFSRDCGACHSTSPDTIIVGPSLAGIASLAETRVEGQDGYTYLLTSVMQPEAYLVEGYENLMPASLSKQLTGEELDAVIAYLQTLE